MPDEEAPRCSWTTTTIRSPERVLATLGEFAVAMSREWDWVVGSASRGVWRLYRTDAGGTLLADDEGALDQGSARIVDAV